jgi:pyruvate/2-oxoglutarate dehydrogenase complex dihydrolipoamide dehydrogenase (E3) component
VNIKEITKDGVRYEHEEKEYIGKADQVIIAMGANPNLSLSNAIEAQGIPTSSIGDCTSVGYIHGAIAEARVAVLEL